MNDVKPPEWAISLRALAIVVLVLAWISYFWERFTGVTFVFSKSSRALGNNSSPAHLSSTLEGALIATLICVALFYVLGKMIRPPEP